MHVKLISYLLCSLLTHFVPVNGQTGHTMDTTTIPVSYKPVSLKAKDMNNDEITDLVIMPTASDTVFTIYYGLGNENFSIPFSNKKDENYSPFDVADLNRDNIQDVVIASYWNNGFKVYFGDINDKFIPGPAYNMGAHATKVSITDIDNDGFQDVLGISSGSINPVTLQVYKGDQNGDLQFSGKYPTLLSGNISTYITDKNGDDLQDIVVSTHDWLALFYQKNDGTFLLKYWPTYGASVVIEDINNDHNPDMILGYSSFGADKSGDSILIRLGEADTLFSLNPIKILVPGLNSGTMLVHDLDNDTYPELLVNHLNNNGEKTDSLFIFTGLGNIGFQFKKVLHASGPIQNFTVADLGNDSYPEIIAISPENITIMHNHGNILSTNDPVNQKPFRMYPNPASDWLFLDLPEANHEVRIFDKQGRICYISKHNGFSKINVSAWTAGIYFGRIYQNNTLLTTQVFIKL